MDPLALIAEATAAFKAAEDIIAMAQRLIAAAQSSADPTAQELSDAKAAAQAVNDRIHAITGA